MKIFLNIIILFLLIYSDLIFAKTKLNLEDILNETQKQEHLIDEFKKDSKDLDIILNSEINFYYKFLGIKKFLRFYKKDIEFTEIDNKIKDRYIDKLNEINIIIDEFENQNFLKYKKKPDLLINESNSIINQTTELWIKRELFLEMGIVLKDNRYFIKAHKTLEFENKNISSYEIEKICIQQYRFGFINSCNKILKNKLFYIPKGLRNFNFNQKLKNQEFRESFEYAKNIKSIKLIKKILKKLSKNPNNALMNEIKDFALDPKNGIKKRKSDISEIYKYILLSEINSESKIINLDFLSNLSFIDHLRVKSHLLKTKYSNDNLNDYLNIWNKPPKNITFHYFSYINSIKWVLYNLSKNNLDLFFKHFNKLNNKTAEILSSNKKDLIFFKKNINKTKDEILLDVISHLNKIDLDKYGLKIHNLLSKSKKSYFYNEKSKQLFTLGYFDEGYRVMKLIKNDIKNVRCRYITELYKHRYYDNAFNAYYQNDDIPPYCLSKISQLSSNNKYDYREWFSNFLISKNNKDKQTYLNILAFSLINDGHLEKSINFLPYIKDSSDKVKILMQIYKKLNM